MNQIVVSSEVLDRFHELAEATHRSETEIINEALAGYLTAAGWGRLLTGQGDES